MYFLWGTNIEGYKLSYSIISYCVWAVNADKLLTLSYIPCMIISVSTYDSEDLYD